ncbi:MAG: hypothetical protein ACE5KM_16715 [Planctomycetaceae bacterium]
MARKVGLLLIAVVIVVGAVYKLREVPAVGRLLLRDTDPAELGYDWPPKVGHEYPDLVLLDQTGRETRLSRFRGKILLVELIGTPCGACQAFAGAHDVGVFRGGELQPNLESIETYARRYGKFDLNHKDVVYVQLLLFNRRIQAPSLEEAKAWARHFGRDRSKNQIVLVGTADLATNQSYEMVPGFHLIDRNFILRRDSSGHQPVHNLYTDLLPTMGRLVGKRR